MKKVILLVMLQVFALSVLCAANLEALPNDSTTDKDIQLDSVSVVADNITHYADRDVVFITRSMRKGKHNTAQLLSAIPGIDCNYSDNELSYYGRKNILLLVDSIEKPDGYIKELNHIRFNKVEVIPNPSGKYANYDAVINLKTKPDYEGYEGNINTLNGIIPTNGNGTGKNYPANYSSASFTYTKNKWNIVGSYDYKFTQSENTRIEKTSENHVNGLSETFVDPSVSKYFRIHNAYAAADYQINKNHSLSLSYKFSTDASDDYTRDTDLRSWLDSGLQDTVGLRQKSSINSRRHTVGFYYRGKSGVWRYTYDLNYINDGWHYTQNYDQTSGYSNRNLHCNYMNYVWSKAEVNRNFFDNKFCVSAGYNFTLKDYTQRNRQDNSLLSDNKYVRNELWTWMSYRFNSDMDLNFSASIENIHTTSFNYKDDNLVYKLSGKFFRRWNKQFWTRVNYSANVTRPDLSQVTDYGYFADSLTWKAGNPALKTQVYHTAKIHLDFFNLFNIETGCDFSNNYFSTIIEEGEGTLPSGVYGRYLSYVPQNTKFRAYWTTIYASKRIKNFSCVAFAHYLNVHASYHTYSNTSCGWRGQLMAQYYLERNNITTQLYYAVCNGYGATAQIWEEEKRDCFILYVGKYFSKQNLNIAVRYISPHIFMSGKDIQRTNSEAKTTSIIKDIDRNNAHAIEITLSYRIQGGKSVRQYNREMQNEK
jgi:hypothetical protein